MLEWYEDLYDEKDALEAQLEEGLDTGQVYSRLAEIDKILEGDDAVSTTGDPLIDYWEAQIARGEVPDLDMTVEDLRARTKHKGRT